MSHANNAISCKGVSFSYNGVKVLDDITFEVKQGDYVGMIGPNGGGKTTIVKLLLGILEPTQGTIELFGEPHTKARETYGVGYVPQRVSQVDLQFPATVEEVVRSGRTARRGLLHGLSKADSRAIFDAMDVAGIAELKQRRIGELSGGQRQRVFIAQALAAKPEILILDEPTVGVDQASQESFYAFLKHMNTSLGMTIVLISHDIDMVAKDITSLLCVNTRLVAEGKPDRILREDHLKELYGAGVMHIHHHHDHA